MFSLFERIFDFFVVPSGVGEDIHTVALFQKCVIILPREFRIQNGIAIGRDEETVYGLTFPGIFILHILFITTHDTEIQAVTFRSNPGTGYTGGSLQVDDGAVFFQIVEISLPIGTDGKDIGSIFLDIVNLLPFIFFHDDLVGKSRLLHALNSFRKGLFDIDLATVVVKIVRSDPDNQVIAQGSGTLQKP